MRARTGEGTLLTPMVLYVLLGQARMPAARVNKWARLDLQRSKAPSVLC